MTLQNVTSFQSFDVDMEGVKMLRILAYKKGKVDVLLGKCTLEVNWVFESKLLVLLT